MSNEIIMPKIMVPKMTVSSQTFFTDIQSNSPPVSRFVPYFLCGMASRLVSNLDILKKKPYTHYLVSHIAILLPHCSPLWKFHDRAGVSQSQLMLLSLSCCSAHLHFISIWAAVSLYLA